MKLFYEPQNPPFTNMPAYARQMLTLTESTFLGFGNPPTYQGIKNALTVGIAAQYPRAWLAVDLENASTSILSVLPDQSDAAWNVMFDNVRFLLKATSRQMRPSRRRIGYYAGGPFVVTGRTVVQADYPSYFRRLSILAKLDPYMEVLYPSCYYINPGDPLVNVVGPLGDPLNNTVEAVLCRKSFRRQKARFRPQALGAKPLVAYLNFYYQVDGVTKVSQGAWDQLLTYLKNAGVYGINVWRGNSAQLPFSDPLVTSVINICDTF